MQNVDSPPESGSFFNERLRDIEYSGQLNRATQQGAKFALLLSMLEQNPLHRPQIADDVLADTSQAQLAALSHYPVIPLAADAQYWLNVQQTEKFIQNAELDNAKLWLTMHPEPLSLYNDAKHIDDEVLANCALTVQERWQQTQQSKIEQDATGLFDILQEVHNVKQPQVAV